MNPQKNNMSVLAQISSWIPDRIADNFAKKHKIQTRSFSPFSHVLAMVYAHLAHSLSLNDLCDDLRNHAGTLSQIRSCTPPKETSTTHTNTTTSTKENHEMESNTITHTVSAPVQTVAQNHEPELNPLDELMANIEAMKAKLKAMFDESAAMSRKVREVALAQRQKEREYVQTKRTIERIRTASGF